MVVLVGLGIAVFTTDLSSVFISVGAPVSSGNRNSDKISLMFVVENDANFLDEVIELLKETGTPATFFVGGGWASRNRDKVIKLAQDFELGNHAYNNRSLAGMKEGDQRAEISNCHSMVHTITSSTQISITENNQESEEDFIKSKQGVEMKLFLPPNGSFNRRTLRSAEQLGYRTVMWSKNATQTAGNISTVVILNTATDVRGGDLVLLRPDSATFAVLRSILNSYETQTLQIVSVSNNIL